MAETCRAGTPGQKHLPVDFLFQESLLYTSISLRRNVAARISLIRLNWVDTLRRVHNVDLSYGQF